MQTLIMATIKQMFVIYIPGIPIFFTAEFSPLTHSLARVTLHTSRTMKILVIVRIFF